MTDTEINIAIAESLGYVIKPHEKDRRGRPCATRLEWFRNANSECPIGFSERPNYTSSLDACAEFEKTMDNARWWKWADFLAEICGAGVALCISATPIQRCEAYLRTIGAWKEPNQQPE